MRLDKGGQSSRTATLGAGNLAWLLTMSDHDRVFVVAPPGYAMPDALRSHLAEVLHLGPRRSPASRPCRPWLQVRRP